MHEDRRQFKPVELTPEDLEFLESRRTNAAETIARWSGKDIQTAIAYLEGLRVENSAGDDCND